MCHQFSSNADGYLNNCLRTDVDSDRRMYVPQFGWFNAFGQQILKDQFDLASAANHSDVPCSPVHQVIKRILIVIVSSRHDENIGVAGDLQIQQNLRKGPGDSLGNLREAFRTDILGAVVNQADVKVELSGQIRYRFSDMPAGDDCGSRRDHVPRRSALR